MSQNLPSKPLPYYRWYWQEYRANRTVQRMSFVERGLYRELLDECWAEGSIPTDMESLADICGCPVDVLASAWHMLGRCFTLSDGRYYNEKLHLLRTESDAERIKRRNSGRSGGVRKALNQKDSVASASACQTVASTCHIEENRREENFISPSGDIKRARRAVTITADDLTRQYGVDSQVASDFIALRKSKRSNLTATALAGLIAEYGRAGLSVEAGMRVQIQRGWQGFNADWLNENKKQRGNSVYEQRRNTYEILTGKRDHGRLCDGVSEVVDRPDF